MLGTRADPGAQGGDDDGPGHVLGSAEGDLRQACGVGVVESGHRPPQVLAHELGEVDARPGLVEIGDEGDGAVDDRSGQGHADRDVVAHLELLEELTAHLSDSRGSGLLRSVDANALADERARGQVDQGALDA